MHNEVGTCKEIFPRFFVTNPSVKGQQESEICNGSAILEVSGKLNLLMNFIRVPLIVLGFFNFHFSVDFIGGQ